MSAPVEHLVDGHPVIVRPNVADGRGWTATCQPADIQGRGSTQEQAVEAVRAWLTQSGHEIQTVEGLGDWGAWTARCSRAGCVETTGHATEAEALAALGIVDVEVDTKAFDRAMTNIAAATSADDGGAGS